MKERRSVHTVGVSECIWGRAEKPSCLIMFDISGVHEQQGFPFAAVAVVAEAGATVRCVVLVTCATAVVLKICSKPWFCSKSSTSSDRRCWLIQRNPEDSISITWNALENNMRTV